MCRRRIKQAALFPVIATGSVGFALVLVYLSYRSAGAAPIYDPIHQE